MTCQIETGASSARATSYHDLLNKMVSFKTSRHVATVAINAAGVNFVVGDIVTLTHAGAHLDAKFEVLTLSGSAIATMRIHSNGAFGDRPNGTITITVGGTGYAVSATDVILELQGGTSRCPTKIKATTDGAGIVTSAVDFEDLGTSAGGVYSALPSYPAATVIKGPNGTAAGTGCTITMGGSTGIIGTTALAVTGGSGTGATVDITLAETGWTVDGRNDNDRVVNTVLNEKSVVLVGDAVGQTNKPFTAYLSLTVDNGLDTRFAIACFGLIAHNPALNMSNQSFRSPGMTDETTFINGGSYILCPEDTGAGTDEMDFWMKGDDQHFSMMTQIKESAAISDDGIYLQHYAGLMNRIGTETESPYAYYVFSSSRAINVDPEVGSVHVTSLCENRMQTSGCGWFYDNVSSTWRNVQNDDTSGSPSNEGIIMSPCGRPFNNSANNVDNVVMLGNIFISLVVFELDRGATVLILRKVPGTASEFFLWPLTIRRQDASAPDATTDRLYGQLRDIFWVSSDDGAGARIVNFSEDYITVGGDRYLIFHNHDQIKAYQYVAWKWDS